MDGWTNKKTAPSSAPSSFEAQSDENGYIVMRNLHSTVRDNFFCLCVLRDGAPHQGIFLKVEAHIRLIIENYHKVLNMMCIQWRASVINSPLATAVDIVSGMVRWSDRSL
ncbi:uncharacterized protein LACBIDRAFT_322868 [Laccaria bicolor S238N-H82]|uniref:Predicted protein n=1 Tax=Laccaria bicolor (strain S238N-H82 / ATCC MYA-4686) TaxID=486041 RepID=B0CVE1_LACBS|nr:uncharacterized protein LACBIDRAFT_322868 [Laccaria bicolor S238N-H82]EDR13315.1 predicted protein [Laccaria bicolor S238N-H82]|eukprot:XP_001875813.1 predicted protein [Laccaria bicolor S238N-H82]